MTMEADSHSIKKQLEILIIDYFRSVDKNFPKGKLKTSESPDFLLDTSPKNKIGIELTRLYFDDFYTGENELSDDIKKEIVICARELFELSSSLNLFVKVSFSKQRKIIQDKQLSLSALVANAVKKSVKTQNTGSFFSICQISNLPDEIDGIFMATHPVLTESVWEVADSPKKNYETILKIRQLIAKKEEKIQLYQKKWLNQCWLIITADRLNNKQKETFHHLIFNSGNSHQFQKIFLFDLLKAQIIQIL